MSASESAERSLSASEYVCRVQAACEYVRSSLVSSGVCSSPHSVSSSLCVGVVLGSGLSDFTRLLPRPLLLHYADIPHMPRPAVSGHHGQLLIGRLPAPTATAATDSTAAVAVASPLVLCFSGRVHSYEGQLSSSVCFIARLCSALGVRCMLYTNSAGGSGPGMAEGSVMLITDHIRQCALNPQLDCAADERLGGAELDCASSPLLYSPALQPLARSAAAACGVRLHEGVYQWSCGPTYESHAEVRAGMRQGVSAFGMSTVPEVMAAASLGLPSMALSLCTNLAAGLSDEQLTHEAVKAVASLAGPRFTLLVHHIVHALQLHTAQQPLTPLARSPIEQPPVAHSAAVRSANSASLAVATADTSGVVTAASACRALKLRPLVGWQPSMAELQVAAGVLLRANIGHPPPLCLLLLPAAATAVTQSSCPLPASLAPLLASTRYVPLSELPGLAQFAQSRTAVTGWLLLATERRSGTRLALLSAAHTEGLTAAESAYLIQSLQLLGTRALVQLADALAAPTGAVHSASASASASTGASEPVDCDCAFVSVCDVLDRSMDAPPALVVPALPTGLSAARAVFDAALADCLERCVAASAVRGGCMRGAVCSFNGPAFPGRAEQRMAAAAGCVAVGVCGVGPLLLASRCGLLTAALWRLSAPTASALGGQSEDAIHGWSALLGELTSAVAAHIGTVTASTPSPACAPPTPSTLPASSTSTATTAVARLPSPYACEQESWPAVSSEAERLLSLLSSDVSATPDSAHTALVLDAVPGWRLPASFQSLASAPFTWPHPLQPAAAPGSGWIIHSGHMLGRPLYCACPSSSIADSNGRVLSGVVPLVRVLWRMGVRSVLLGFPATSLTASLPVGSAALVSDHVNLTGMNPLFGLNEDRYGPRFPDCSSLYTVAADEHTVSAVLASVSGWCDAASPCERRWLLDLGAQLVVWGQAADAATVARQMGISTTAVAAITHCAVDESDNNERVTRTWLPAVSASAGPMETFDQLVNILLARPIQ